MFYIYRITNLVNGKTYIGQHKRKLSEVRKGRTPWNKGKHQELVDGKRVWH